MSLGPLIEWNSPPGLLFRPTRRAFLIGASAAGISVAKTNLTTPRDLIRQGALGRIVFCRAFQPHGADATRTLQFLLDAPQPLSTTDHGAGRVTVRYPGFLASYEPDVDAAGMVICGSRATLAVNSDGWRLISPFGEA